MSESDNNNGGMSRRQVLAGGAAIAASAILPGCGENPQKPAATQTSTPLPTAKPRQVKRALQNDMIDALEASEAKFVDSNGEEVNLKALQTALHGNPSTLSFMFSSCSDVCPTTASVLSAISSKEENNNLHHVIVSTDPFNDYMNESLVKFVEVQGLHVDGPNANTTILYPTLDGTDAVNSLIGGVDKVPGIQHRLELLTNGSEPSGHSGAVTLFDASGKLRVQAINNRDAEPMIEQLNQALNAIKSPKR